MYGRNAYSDYVAKASGGSDMEKKMMSEWGNVPPRGIDEGKWTCVRDIVMGEVTEGKSFNKYKDPIKKVTAAMFTARVVSSVCVAQPNGIQANFQQEDLKTIVKSEKKRVPPIGESVLKRGGYETFKALVKNEGRENLLKGITGQFHNGVQQIQDTVSYFQDLK